MNPVPTMDEERTDMHTQMCTCIYTHILKEDVLEKVHFSSYFTSLWFITNPVCVHSARMVTAIVVLLHGFLHLTCLYRVIHDEPRWCQCVSLKWLRWLYWCWVTSHSARWAADPNCCIWIPQEGKSSVPLRIWDVVSMMFPADEQKSLVEPQAVVMSNFSPPTLFLVWKGELKGLYSTKLGCNPTCELLLSS